MEEDSACEAMSCQIDLSGLPYPGWVSCKLCGRWFHL